MIDLISILKRDFFKVKIEIYYQTMEVTTKNIFKSLFSCIVIWLEIAIEIAAIESILMIYRDKSI